MCKRIAEFLMRSIIQRPVYKSNLAGLVEESTPDDGPVALSTDTAEPAPLASASASTPEATPTTPAAAPAPTLGPFAQTPIGTPESMLAAHTAPKNMLNQVAYWDGAPQHEVSTNSPVEDGIATNPHTPAQSPTNGVLANKQLTNESAESGPAPSIRFR
ncbi:uncharacterized protein DFL_003066 [Arthrobotrys flagrans]|uniref:Uncharacterized protein n=1 Tax=Arthrobotrys flagrans TaxID=97331 RepID=A0A437ACG8_ARTFL|nr:hypothetical protein DFL_003066 [Arthrobotrys flagrans]